MAAPAAKAARNPSPPTATARRVRREDEAHAVERLVLPADAEPAVHPGHEPGAQRADPETEGRAEHEELAEDASPTPPAVEASARTTAIVMRTTGSTTMSFVAASVVSDWRTAPGIRLSRTTSRTTTGSVEDRIAPTRIEDARPRPRRKCAPRGDENERQDRARPEHERGHEPLARATGRTSSARRRGTGRAPA